MPILMYLHISLFLLAVLGHSISCVQLRQIQTQPLVWFHVNISDNNAYLKQRNYFGVGKEN